MSPFPSFIARPIDVLVTPPSIERRKLSFVAVEPTERMIALPFLSLSFACRYHSRLSANVNSVDAGVEKNLQFFLTFVSNPAKFSGRRFDTRNWWSRAMN